MDNRRVGVIILAGGKGERFHGQKQFVEFKGKPLWQNVYDKVKEVVPKSNIIVVGIDVPGGRTRAISVRNGLMALNDIDKVVIVEAARPLVTIDQIKIIIEAEGDSISYVIPCPETVITNEKKYLRRKDLFFMQCPQAFNYKLLRNAMKDEDKYADRTEESRIMSDEYGIDPVFLEGGQNLFKVTFPNDIKYLENFVME